MLRRVENIFWEVILLLLMVACGIDGGGVSRVPFSESLGSVKAFEKSVYPIVRDKCKNCHGQNQSPQFAVSNLTTAHDKAVAYVRFSVPEESRLAVYGGNAHCGVNCNATTESSLAAAIALWKELADEIDQNDEDFSLQTIEKTVPDVSTGKKQVDFPLDNLGYPGAQLSIDVERFVDGVYRFGNPRLKTGAQGVALSDLRVLINGYWDPSTMAFRDIERHVVAGQNLTALSTLTMLVFEKDGPLVDKMSLVVGEINTGCANLPTFITDVKPILMNCRGCHDSASAGYDPGAVKAFNINGTDGTLCYRSLRRSSPDNLANSVLIQAPLQGTPMYTTPQISAAQADTILQWLQSE